MPKQDKPIIAEIWYRLYPELRHFKSREEMRELKKVFRKQAFVNRRAWGLVLLITMVCGGLSSLTSRWLLSFGLSLWLACAIIIASCAFLGATASLFFWHRPYIRFLRQYLQDHGKTVCLKCGYDLRGQTEPRCPECGCATESLGKEDCDMGP